MQSRPFQFALWNLLASIAAICLVMGAATGIQARYALLISSAVIVLAAPCVLGLFLFVLGRHVYHFGFTLPRQFRQRIFRRRWARLRPGLSSGQVQHILGQPARIEGFGDRTYWSYLVAGQRFTVSLDPRNLVATYSNGLARDRVRIESY